LEDPDNGMVEILNGTLSGMTATYTCSAGYMIAGDINRECSEFGWWEGNEPTCINSNTAA